MEPINPNRTRIISLSAYSVMFALGMALTTWHELSMAQGRAPLEIVVAIIINAQAVAVAAAGFAALVETGGYVVLLAAHIIQKEQEKALAKGVKQGLEQGIEQGLEQGIEQGIDKAYKDADEQLAAYFKRMDAARAAGEDFDEPRPRFRRNGQ